MQTRGSSSLPQLRGLLEVSRLVRDERDLRRLCERIAETISESLGFRTVAINLLRPAEGDFEVVTVHGNEDARAALLGSTRPADAWLGFLVERFDRRGAYLIPHDEADWEGVLSHVPDLPLLESPDAWHPEDALMVPMRAGDGTLLGVVSVDEPESGVRPTDDELDVLVAFAEHVAAALESAQDAAAAARDRTALVRLLDVSASLVDLESVDAVLETVARAIHEALEFEKVAVSIADESGRLVPRGTAGWEPGDPGLDFTLTSADLEALFVPEFEIEGCYLIERAVANALVGNGSVYTSQRGGAGPRAWKRHWLLVPLEVDGTRSGFLWADDPADSMLPSRERLQALRTFANQATVALRAAQDFAALSARAGELVALHETTLALLEEHEPSAVLETILVRACEIAGTEHGYIYLVDEDVDRLRLVAGIGFFENLDGPLLERGHGLSGVVWKQRAPLVVDDYQTFPGALPAYIAPAMHATAGVPLRVGDTVVGVLGLVYGAPERRFGPDELALLGRFADLAALALQNARLYAALRHSEGLHRSVLGSSTDMICVVDLQGRLTMMSPASEAILGFAPEELVGRPFAELVHPDDLAAAVANFEQALSEPASLTVRSRRADGSYVILEATASPLLGPDGKTQDVVATVRDVTERQKLEEQLRQAQKMESIGRLAGGIAHDFNNLLTAIRGYAELLLIDFDSGATPARDNAEQIARAADRAASLTGQLLAYSRKQVLRPQTINLNEVVSGMASMLSRMLGEDVVLSTALDGSIGPVHADPTQLEQVVLNLAINARDAMPGGGNLVVATAPLEVSAAGDRHPAGLEPGAYVTLTVRDSGVGIEPEVAAQVFEPFFTTKAVGEGTGLGLATVHGIVSQSGGAVWMDTAPGEGTCFTVCLPRAAAG